MICVKIANKYLFNFDFSFDRIYIYLEESPRTVRRKIDISTLKTICKSISVTKTDFETYKSKLDIVAPTNEIFEKLSEVKFNGEPKISYLEFAFDETNDIDNLPEVYKKAKYLARILKKIRKSGNKFVEIEEPKIHKNRQFFYYAHPDKKNIEKGKRIGKSPRTVIYLATPKNENYKTSKKIVLRFEIRINSAANIYDRTGISEAKDILNFNPNPLFKKLFNVEMIDHRQLGRWVLGLKPSQKTDSWHLKRLIPHARVYLKSNKITSSDALRAHFLKFEKEFKEEMSKINSYNNQWNTGRPLSMDSKRELKFKMLKNSKRKIFQTVSFEIN